MAGEGIQAVYSLEQIRMLLEKVPRVSLANLPTPLEECKRLSQILLGPRIWMKRDDQTGLAFGGNGRCDNPGSERHCHGCWQPI